MREARGIECNFRVNDFRGLSKEIIDMGKELEREQGGGADRSAFMSTKATVYRHDSNLSRAMGWS